MFDKEKKLSLIRAEMENVRELYIKGLIDKITYQNETRDLFEVASRYGA